MLPKSSRLKKPELFQKAFRFGKPFFFGNVGCKILFSGGNGKKIGFSLSKKLFPHAVDRNRAKRLLSEAVGLSWNDIPEDVFMVFFLRGREGFSEKEKISKDVSGLISRLNGYKQR